jgi:hypothetical protein
MVIDHPDLASSYVAGKTEENRELKVLVVKTPSSSRAIWIDCGFHAVRFSNFSNSLFRILLTN